jgi:hypothetical protein
MIGNFGGPGNVMPLHSTGRILQQPYLKDFMTKRMTTCITSSYISNRRET